MRADRGAGGSVQGRVAGVATPPTPYPGTDMAALHALLPAHKVPRIAPNVARCPRCGAHSPRNEVRRLERHAACVDMEKKLAIEVGCYLCPECPAGERWFRLQPVGFEERSRYTTQTRTMVVSLVKDHKLSFDGAAAVGRALLHLPALAGTTVMRWFREAGDGVDYRGHLARVAETFSGQLAIDEVYDGGFYVLKATDPLNGVELTSWLGEGNPSEADIRELFLELKAAGIVPEWVVTDGSRLYPKVISEVFPDAGHQRCVFHFIKRALELLAPAFHGAVRSMPQPKKRKRGRPKKRGRPRKDKEKRANLRNVRKCRYLVFKRDGIDNKGRPRMSPSEEKALAEALALCPPLAILRQFVGALYELFGPTTVSQEVAERRRQAILSDERFQEHAAIGKVVAHLADDALFTRLTRYLDFENADKTSNHPERENREFRKRQRSHYRLRSVVSMCAFLDLMLVRRDPPGEPRRLRRRRTTPAETLEVLAA